MQKEGKPAARILARSVRWFVLNASHRLVPISTRRRPLDEDENPNTRDHRSGRHSFSGGMDDRNLDRKMLFILKYESL